MEVGCNWEVLVRRGDGDDWPRMTAGDGREIDPDAVNIGFTALPGQPPALLPVDVWGWVPRSHPRKRAGREIGADVAVMPPWLKEVVLAAARQAHVPVVRGGTDERRQ